MGNIDDAVPFFGKGFNKIYPLIMVVYTILVASNFFNRVINYFGSLKIFRLQTEADDMDGFDPSGLLILQKGNQSLSSLYCCIICPIWRKAASHALFGYDSFTLYFYRTKLA